MGGFEDEMRAKRAIKMAEKDHEENLARAKLISQVFMIRFGLRHNQKPGRVFVEPMDDAGAEVAARIAPHAPFAGKSLSATSRSCLRSRAR